MAGIPDYTVAMRTILLLAALIATAAAQEKMTAREKPEEYPARAKVGNTTIAAEFVGRTVPSPGGGLVLRHYVVVEVAIYGGEFTFQSTRYTLKVNGKVPALLAQTAGMVEASVKYPSWEGQRGVTMAGGMGNGSVILGRDTRPRFPGDRRYPGPTGSVQNESETNGQEPWAWVSKLGWDDGPGKGPAAGLLFFPYEGNLVKVRTIELSYSGPDGEATLGLRVSTASPARSGAPAGKP
jgi:hypothetical protein